MLTVERSKGKVNWLVKYNNVTLEVCSTKREATHKRDTIYLPIVGVLA